MPRLARSVCPLHYDLVDLAVPWISPPETIVFCHGIGSSSPIWRGWLPSLVERYRILSFDLRGHGQSARPTQSELGTFDDLVQDIFAVADAAGVQRFHLMGESIGGTLALQAALDKPERIATLTVSNGTHLGGSVQAIQDWHDIIDSRGMAGWSRHMMAARFHPGALEAGVSDWYEQQQACADPAFVLHAAALLSGTDLTARLAELRLPILLLHPDGSPFISVELMAKLKAQLRTARLQVFPHSRHGLPFSHGAECARVVRMFLEQAAGTA